MYLASDPCGWHILLPEGFSILEAHWDFEINWIALCSSLRVCLLPCPPLIWQAHRSECIWLHREANSQFIIAFNCYCLALKSANALVFFFKHVFCTATFGWNDGNLSCSDQWLCHEQLLDIIIGSYLQALVVCLTLRLFRNKCTFSQLSMILAWVKLEAQPFVILPCDHQLRKSSFPLSRTICRKSVSRVPAFCTPKDVSVFCQVLQNYSVCCVGSLRGGICPAVWVWYFFSGQCFQSSYCKHLRSGRCNVL